jgi:hypothetical protein
MKKIWIWALGLAALTTGCEKEDGKSEGEQLTRNLTGVWEHAYTAVHKCAVEDYISIGFGNDVDGYLATVDWDAIKKPVYAENGESPFWFVEYKSDWQYEPITDDNRKFWLATMIQYTGIYSFADDEYKLIEADTSTAIIYNHIPDMGSSPFAVTYTPQALLYEVSGSNKMQDTLIFTRRFFEKREELPVFSELH